MDRTADFAWTVEDPDEFDLRMLLHHFERREELLERIGRFEYDPALPCSEQTVVDLGHSLAAAYKRAALLHGAQYFPWAASSNPLDVLLLPSGAPAPKSNDVPDIYECVGSACRPQLIAVTGAPALMTVLEGRVNSIGLYYLLGPFLTADSEFSCALALEKMRVDHWIDKGGLTLRVPVHDPWADQDEAVRWDPQLEWPSKKDIARWAAVRHGHSGD